MANNLISSLSFGKKSYSAPTIKFFPLTLSASLSSCDGASSSGDSSSPLTIDGWDETVLTVDKGCDAYTPAGVNGICYSVMTEDSTIISS